MDKTPCRTLLGAAICALLVSSLQAQPVTATWNISSGDWNTTSQWDCNCFPNNGGGTTYATVLNSTGNTLTLGSSVTVDSVSLQVGTLQIGSGGSLMVAGTTALTGGVSNGYFTSVLELQNGAALTTASVTNQGQIITGNAMGDMGNNTLNVTGTFANSGLLQLMASGDTAIVGPLNNSNGFVEVASGAALTVNGNTTNNGSLLLYGGMTVHGNLTNSGGTFGFQLVQGTLSVSGTLTNDSGSRIVAGGTISGGSLTNNGFLTTCCGTLDLSGINVTNLSGGTLTGGYWDVSDGSVVGSSTLKLPSNIVTNSAYLLLFYAGSQILNASNTNALSGFNANQGGTFIAGGGAALTTGGDFLNNNNSLLEASNSLGGNTSSLTVSGNLTNSNNSTVTASASPPNGGGSIAVTGQLSNDGTSTVQVQNGSTLSAASVNNSGQFLTGNASGDTGGNSVSVSGTFSNNGGGVLNLMAPGDTATFGGLVNNGSATVSAGAILNTASATIGSTLGPSGSVTVTGTGAQWINSGALTIGNAGEGTLAVTGGGFLSSASATVGAESGSIGIAIIDASTWNNAGLLSIGVSGIGIVELLDGAVLESGTTIVGANGALHGDPSTVDVNGNFTLDPLGVLTLDIDGAGLGQFSQLFISGTGLFQGIIDIDFIDGFAPSEGESFDLINALSADFSGATVHIEGLAPGFQYTDSFANGQFDLLAQNNGETAAPEPGTLSLLSAGLIVLSVVFWWRRPKRRPS